MTLRIRTHAPILAAVLAVASLLIGCVDSAVVDNTERDAAIYRSIIADVVDRSEVVLDSTTELPVLFIEAFDADGIDLQVQVEVVGSFIEMYEIRFIDVRDEAIEVDLVGLPVRVNSLLIGLGPIVFDGTVNVRSELYMSKDELSAYRYTLTGSGGSWLIVGAPAEIEPERFVTAS